MDVRDGVRVLLSDGVLLWVAVSEAVADCDADWLGDAEDDGDDDWEGEEVLLRVCVRVPELDRERVCVCERVGAWLGVSVCEGLRVGVPVAEGVPERVLERVTVWLGDRVWLSVPVDVAETVALAD